MRGAGRRRLAVLMGVLALALGAQLLVGVGGATHHTVHALQAAAAPEDAHDHGEGAHGASGHHDHDHVVAALCSAVVAAALVARAGAWPAGRRARRAAALPRTPAPSWPRRLGPPGPRAPTRVDAGVVLVV